MYEDIKRNYKSYVINFCQISSFFFNNKLQIYI